MVAFLTKLMLLQHCSAYLVFPTLSNSIFISHHFLLAQLFCVELWHLVINTAIILTLMTRCHNSTKQHLSPRTIFLLMTGTHMLDTCPPSNSCGAVDPLWTNDVMPTRVGVVTKIIAYISFGLDDCMGLARDLKAIRCSLRTEHDFVYKYTGFYASQCKQAFCGMA